MMKRTLVPALVLATAAAAPATSNAEVTGNVGFVTDYLFRGIFQSESSAYAGADLFALDVAVGQYDGDKFNAGDPVAGGDQDYIFTSVTLTPEMGPYYKVGMWSGDYVDNILPQVKSGTDDPDGIYFEIGYSYEIEDHGIVFSAALDWSSDLIVGFPNGTGEYPDYALTFGIKKNLGGE